MKKIFAVLFLVLTMIIATIKPVHAVDSVIHGPDVVFKEVSAIVTIYDILLLYESDGRVLSISNDGYTGNGAVVGSYNVTIAASDGLTEILRTIQVKVLLSIGDVTLVDNLGNIYVRPDQTLDFTKIRNVLRNVNLISISVGTGYQILIDEYTGHETEEGNYNYGFRLISSSGAIQNVSIKIFVTEDFTSFEPGDIIPPDPNPLLAFGSMVWNAILFIITIGILGILLYVGYKVSKKIKKGVPR